MGTTIRAICPRVGPNRTFCPPAGRRKSEQRPAHIHADLKTNIDAWGAMINAHSLRCTRSRDAHIFHARPAQVSVQYAVFVLDKRVPACTLDLSVAVRVLSEGCIARQIHRIPSICVCVSAFTTYGEFVCVCVCAQANNHKYAILINEFYLTSTTTHIVIIIAVVVLGRNVDFSDFGFRLLF